MKTVLIIVSIWCLLSVCLAWCWYRFKKWEERQLIRERLKGVQR